MAGPCPALGRPEHSLANRELSYFQTEGSLGMRNLVLVLALALCAAGGAPVTGAALAAGAGAAGAEAETETRLVEAIQLRVRYDGREIDLLMPVGTSGTITDHQRGIALQLVPSMEPSPPDGERQVSLQVLEVPAPAEHAGHQFNLVDVLLLTEKGSARGLRHLAFEAEFVGVEELGVPLEFGTHGSEGLRPFDCCVTCNGVTSCGFCVWTSCGSCCAGPDRP